MKTNRDECLWARTVREQPAPTRKPLPKRQPLTVGTVLGYAMAVLAVAFIIGAML